MQAEQSIFDIIKRRQLKWYGHLIRIKGNYWLKIFQWAWYGRKRRGRPQQLWKNQVVDLMRSRRIKEDIADDKNHWPLGINR